jgi:hypothetical protein
MARLAIAMLVRIGLVLLVLAVLVRLLPMPDRADVAADDLAIAVSLLLVLAAASYLRLTRNAAAQAERPGTPGHQTPGHQTSAPRTPR